MTPLHPQHAWLLALNRLLPPNKQVEVSYTVKEVRKPVSQIHHFPVGHRIILPCEFVVEFDYPDWRVNAQLTRSVCAHAAKKKIPFLVGFTGNKSFHIHIFADFRDVPVPEAAVPKLSNGGAYRFRNYVFRRTFGRFIKRIEGEINGAGFDSANFHRNKLIREFGGRHEKTGQRKTLVDWHDLANMKQPPMLVRIPEAVPLWRNERLFARLLENYARARDDFNVIGHSRGSPVGCGRRISGGGTP